jgi:glycine cleavage system aminomethyltransferase T
LRKIKQDGVKRHQLGLILEGAEPAPLGFKREDIFQNGERVGMMTNCVWSPRMKANIGYALISVDAKIGTSVEISRPDGVGVAQLVELPFL